MQEQVQIMEADPNPMPEIKLFEIPAIIKKIGHFLFDQFQSEGLSEHFQDRNDG